ncbi:MAG: DUF362 domain-containing protein [Patescibacteria group bacterium]
MSKVALIGKQGRGENITQALSLVGDNFISKFHAAKKPLIKVNFVSSTRQLAATHVDAVRTVLNFLLPYTDKKITIAEASVRNTKTGFENFGYTELQKDYEQIELVDLNGTQTEEHAGFSLSKIVLDSDFRISIGPPKTHDTTIITAAMKNMAVGSIITGEGVLGRHLRSGFHQGSYRDSNKRLVDIYQFVFPHLAVVDGFLGMQGSGPSSGDPVESDWALVGTNAVEVDAVCAYLMGYAPEDIGYLWFAQEKGLGKIDLSEIEIEGDEPEQLRREFANHPNYVSELSWREHA